MQKENCVPNQSQSLQCTYFHVCFCVSTKFHGWEIQTLETVQWQAQYHKDGNWTLGFLIPNISLFPLKSFFWQYVGFPGGAGGKERACQYKKHKTPEFVSYGKNP